MAHGGGLDPRMTTARRQKPHGFITENTYDSPVTSSRDHYEFAPRARQMSCYPRRGACVVKVRQCRERDTSSASWHCWWRRRQGCPAVPLGTTAWHGRPAAEQCRPHGPFRLLTRGHG